MNFLPPFLLLILCGSLHACTPRTLTKKDTAKHHLDKELDNVKLLDTLTTLSVKEYKLEENAAQQQKISNDEINICVSCNSASASKEVVVTGSSFQMDLPSILAAKDERGHVRSMLGQGAHHVEETMDTNTNENGEDIVDMDYAQPHRKAPIHNEKP